MGRGSSRTKGNAKPAAPRKSPKSNDAKVRDLKKRLAEALEQQTATAEILRVISSSPTDIKPVLDAVARSAMRLCESYDAMIMLREGEELHFPVHHGPIRGPVQLTGRAISRGWVAGRAVLDRQPVHVHDLATAEAEFPVGQADAVRAGYRTTLSVPLLREGEAIGAIHLRRREVRPFTDNQIALLQTFAAQAVIAIENVRLFTELQEKNRALTQAHAQVTETLEQQTATSEILRVISRSPTDTGPVFDAIVRSAQRLLGGYGAALSHRVGDQVHLGAYTSTRSDGDTVLTSRFPMPLEALVHQNPPLSRVLIYGEIDHVPDFEDPTVAEFSRGLARARGHRSRLMVPLQRSGTVLGGLAVTRVEPGRFSADDIALLQTFADQAVIAIENVRLFKELEARNKDLTEALDQQTATSEVLKVISRSTFDLQPVLETLIENATKLCDAAAGTIWRFDGEVFRVGAMYAASAELRQFWRRGELRPGRGSSVGRAGLERRAVQIVDVLDDPEYQHLDDLQKIAGLRTIVGIPMLREGVLIGAFSLWRTEVRAFTDKQIELVTTFADQAVIAMENVRLLEELRARTGELTRSVEELRALADVSRALSSTLELDTVLQTIVSRASQLAGTDACSVFEYDEATEVFQLRATNNLDEEVVAVARQTPIRKGEGVQGRMALTRQPVQVSDIAAEDAYRGPLRDVLVRTGTRAVLAVPMLRENELIGGLTVNKRTPGEFSPEVIELLTTLATQSALAIQNARLFREIEEKSRQLEVASQHKSEFLANMSHELRTPLNAVIGFSEVLSERMFGDLNEKQDEYLKDIHASGQHLLSLINDILDLSKIEAGKMELELSDFDLPMAIENALTLVRERAARRSIALNTAVDEGVGQVQADERKIRQVLLNLLSNAIKFTPEGGRIHVEARSVNESIEVSVTDTGVGIAPQDQGAVFEEFRQIGAADKKVEGTGLGLALSRKFIELHGGKIWVESQVGEGSTFTFTVPVRRGE